MREEKRYKNSQGAIESKKADLTQEKQKLIDEVKAKTTTSFIHTASVLQKVKRNKKKHSEQHQKQTSRLTEL